MKIKKWIKTTLITMALLIGCLILTISGVFWYGHIKPFRSTQFDKAAWLASSSNESESNKCYRGGMANDISRRILGKHMSKSDVIQLLGEPDSKSTKGEYQYVLGMCSGTLVQIDYDMLYVYFDATGHYSHARIYQH